MKTHSKLVIAGIGTAALLAGGAALVPPAIAAGQPTTATTGGSAAAAITTTATKGTAEAGTAAKKISCRTAVKIAKKRVPGARVTDVEREWEHGHRTCKVELRKGRWEYEVYVSVTTGKIVKFERDQDD
jgi:uncharacterized membrane protein YkoI